MRIVLASLLATLGFLVTAGTSQARVFFEVGEAGSIGTSFDVAPSGSIDLEIYLSEDGKGPPAEKFAISANGDLRSYGVLLTNVDTGDGDTVVSATSFTSNAAFDATGSSSTLTTTSAASDAVALNAPVAPDGSGRVFLGTFTFTVDAGASFGDAMNISITDRFAASPDNRTGNFTDLDPFLSPATITVNVVPEPSSMILCGLAVAGIGGGVLRRRFRKQK